jgi:hypothetical protein
VKRGASATQNVRRAREHEAQLRRLGYPLRGDGGGSGRRRRQPEVGVRRAARTRASRGTGGTPE